MKKINVITLGCSKNTVDSEHLMARLAAAGYEVLFDSDRTDAKVVVINTCGFIGDAKQESIDMILRAAAAVFKATCGYNPAARRKTALFCYNFTVLRCICNGETHIGWV